eukprot:15472326-Alexandrium_andersonii.AAC.1
MATRRKQFAMLSSQPGGATCNLLTKPSSARAQAGNAWPRFAETASLRNDPADLQNIENRAAEPSTTNGTAAPSWRQGKPTSDDSEGAPARPAAERRPQPGGA